MIKYGKKDYVLMFVVHTFTFQIKDSIPYNRYLVHPCKFYINLAVKDFDVVATSIKDHT